MRVLAASHLRITSAEVNFGAEDEISGHCKPYLVPSNGSIGVPRTKWAGLVNTGGLRFHASSPPGQHAETSARRDHVAIILFEVKSGPTSPPLPGGAKPMTGHRGFEDSRIESI